MNSEQGYTDQQQYAVYFLQLFSFFKKVEKPRKQHFSVEAVH